MKLVDAVAPEASAEVATAWFTALVRAAMVPAGAARWRMSWAGQLDLVTPDGEIFDAESVATEIADASTARYAAACLTALGVDVTAVGPVSTTAAVDAGEVMRRHAPVMEIRRRRHMTCSFSKTASCWRRRRQIPRTRAHPASTRSSAADSVAAMVARHRFVPFESIASAKVSGWFTIKATIKLRDGTTLRLKEPMSSQRLKEDSNEVFKAQLARCG